MSQLKESQTQLKLSLKDIQVATKNFENCIGEGGYGLVYKGQLSISGKLTTVAVKRLNQNLGQGLKEFLTEIQFLSGQEHENLISLIGYCDEGREKILVYEYAEHGSLDRHIVRRNSTTYTLTWLERLKICVAAARGLDHLHNHVGEHQTIIHRDIKSANILLDANWVAKISDLGLSKLSLAGLNRSSVISLACGTIGYCEPEYIITGIVKKESDVYSFGMLLFEVLCGRLCMIEEDDGFKLSAQLAKELYENGKLDDIIDPILRKQMNSYSMGVFSSIAYRCLDDDRIQRPPIDLVIKELEESLQFQEEYEKKGKSSGNIVEFDSEEYWKNKLPRDIENFINKLDSFPVYTTSKELFMILRNGISFDQGSRFFSIDPDGGQCETIYANKFLNWKPRMTEKWEPGSFPSDRTKCSVVGQYPYIQELHIRCQIRTSMLSPGIMYAASLVFSFGSWAVWSTLPDFVWIKWKCQDLRVSSAHFVEEINEPKTETGKDRKLKSTLFHFVKNEKNAYFDIELTRIILSNKEYDIHYVTIHAFEFRPVKMLQMKQHDRTHGLESISISSKDMDSEKVTQSDCKDIIHRPSGSHLEYPNSKELYVDPVGVPTDDGRMWLSTCKSTGGKCVMVSAANLLVQWLSTCKSTGEKCVMVSAANLKRLRKLSQSESRFKRVTALEVGYLCHFGVRCSLYRSKLSSRRVYACYLVFKVVDGYTTTSDDHNTSFLVARCHCENSDTHHCTVAHLKLREPINVPIIKPTKNNRVRYSSNIPKFKNCIMPKTSIIEGSRHTWMEHRNDGWMEVILCKSQSNDEDLSLKLDLELRGRSSGVIVEGIEFRPIQADM